MLRELTESELGRGLVLNDDDGPKDTQREREVGRRQRRGELLHEGDRGDVAPREVGESSERGECRFGKRVDGAANRRGGGGCLIVRRRGGEDGDLDAAVAHRARQLAVARVERHDEAEVGMRRDDLDLAVDGPALGELEASTSLEERVEAVKDRGAAQVSVFDKEPVAVLHGLDKRAVDPLEPGGCG